MNGTGSTCGAERVGDRGGGGVGLLRREPALLDREGRRVSGGEHVVGARDVAVRVGRQEPLLVARQPGIAGSGEHGQAEHGVGDDRAALLEPQHVVGDVRRAGVA